MPRAWALRRLDGKGELFLTCPWCAGFWIALGWYAAWQAWEDGTLVVAAAFALSAAVGLVASAHDKMAA